MSALRLDASAPLGLAYACLLAGLALWVWNRRRGNVRARAIGSGLSWAAAALLGLYLLAQMVFARRAMFVGVGDFLAAGALGILLASRMGRADGGRDAAPFAAALVALTHVILWPPATPLAHPAQTTPLYALAAGFRGLGAGACVAAAMGWWAAESNGGADSRERFGLAAMGAGFVLSSAWAWLNWGVAWRSDPRLNLMLAGWLLVLAGRQGGRAAWARAVKTLGVAIVLLGALGGGWIAGGWTYLDFLSW